MADVSVKTTRRAPSILARGATLSSLTLIMAGLLLLLASMASPSRAYAAIVPTVGLGTAGAFSVLGGQTVTNTGPSTLDADLGVFPGNTAPGFPPGIVGGAQHLGDAVANQAQQDLTTSYNNAAGRPTNNNLTNNDLGGLSLIPGVYTFNSSAQLTGALTLDGQNNPDAVFIFQVGSALTTATSSSVNLINGANSCNVFWQIGSSATLGVGTDFVGTVLALTSISATTGASIEGRLLARNGQVSLDTNVITSSTCRIGGIVPTSTATLTVTPTATVTDTASPPVTVTATATAAAVTTTTTVTPTSTTSTTVTPTRTITATSEVTDTETDEATDTNTSEATGRGTGGEVTGPNDTGGGLARTGASASSGLIALGGLLLLLLGGLMLVVTRARTRQGGRHQ